MNWGACRRSPSLGPSHPGARAAFLCIAAGLRDGSNGAKVAYDLSFINSQYSFACLTAAAEGRLWVQERYQGGLKLQVFKLKSTTSEARARQKELAECDNAAPSDLDLLVAVAD